MMPNDYIMRIVQQFIQMLVSIILKRKAGKYEEAVTEIQTAARFYLKTDLALLQYFQPEQIPALFKNFDGKIDTERCVLAADLLNELAQIRSAEQKPVEALRLKKVCLNLYIIALPQEIQFQTTEYFSKVDALLEELKDGDLSEDLKKSLQNYNDFLEHHSTK